MWPHSRTYLGDERQEGQQAQDGQLLVHLVEQRAARVVQELGHALHRDLPFSDIVKVLCNIHQGQNIAAAFHNQNNGWLTKPLGALMRGLTSRPTVIMTRMMKSTPT
jgi:hypothetical protein